MAQVGFYAGPGGVGVQFSAPHRYYGVHPTVATTTTTRGPDYVVVGVPRLASLALPIYHGDLALPPVVLNRQI